MASNKQYTFLNEVAMTNKHFFSAPTLATFTRPSKRELEEGPGSARIQVSFDDDN